MRIYIDCVQIPLMVEIAINIIDIIRNEWYSESIKPVRGEQGERV
jgi:hypothetical protein